MMNPTPKHQFKRQAEYDYYYDEDYGYAPYYPTDDPPVVVEVHQVESTANMQRMSHDECTPNDEDNDIKSIR